MPRLLHHLLDALQKSRGRGSSSQLPSRKQRAPRSLPSYRPLPVTNALLSPHGRTRSVLLEDVNPVEHREAFTRRRKREPSVYAGARVKASSATIEEDEPTVMTEEERERWANPYLRMLSSPMRRCILTNTRLPIDFMIRVSTMRAPTSPFAPVFVPDGVEHPRYRGIRSGYGHYVVCHRAAFDHLLESKAIHRRYLNDIAPTGSLLIQHIGHVLRVRVLQEIELLTGRLQARPLLAESRPVIRRLRRSEWMDIKNEGIINHEGAVAVLVIPPLNRNKETKERPAPSSSSLPAEERPVEGNKSFPISVLHPSRQLETGEDTSGFLPQAQVPLYHGVSLFPLPSQRAALHAGMNSLLGTERRARQNAQGSIDQSQSPGQHDDKSSHAYLLYSNRDSLLRADSVPLAVALWRLRMWEGESWDSRNAEGTYMRNPPWWDRNAER
ncbi:hypothetical protein BDW22DRAFT_521946 [Trametopsis cervina]|nr:hypothetical protein BDW22DRAFT_521946 [Trametopsis cervina]